MCPYLPDIQQSSIESFLRAIYLAEKSENSSKIPFISIDPRPETVSQRQMFFFVFSPPMSEINTVSKLLFTFCYLRVQLLSHTVSFPAVLITRAARTRKALYFLWWKLQGNQKILATPEKSQLLA